MGATHLTQEDRFYIEKRLTDKTSIRCIAKELGRCPGTISREVRRNTPSDFQGLGPQPHETQHFIPYAAFKCCINMS